MLGGSPYEEWKGRMRCVCQLVREAGICAPRRVGAVLRCTHRSALPSPSTAARTTQAPRWPPHTELPIGLVTQVVNLNEKRAFDRLTFRRAADSTAKDRVRYRLEPGESVIFSSGAENAYMVEGDAESENLVLFVRWKRPGTRGQSNRNIAYRSTLGQLRKGAGTSQI